jgi:DNA-binding NtrC family response regulator
VKVHRVIDAELDGIEGLCDKDSETVSVLLGDAKKILPSLQRCVSVNGLHPEVIKNRADLNSISSKSDAVVIDSRDTVINSVLLLDDVKKIVSNMKIIVIVDINDSEIKDKFLNMFPVAGCLFKPIQPDALLDVINQIAVLDV